MAQSARFSAQDNCTDMGLPVVLASANLDPPWLFQIWLQQFLMAVTVKENVNPEILLIDPKEPPQDLKHQGRETTQLQEQPETK